MLVVMINMIGGDEEELTIDTPIQDKLMIISFPTSVIISSLQYYILAIEYNNKYSKQVNVTEANIYNMSSHNYSFDSLTNLGDKICYRWSR